MYRAFLFFLLIPLLPAQILVDTFAGGVVPSGIPAQNAYLSNVSGLAWDGSGNVVFCDSSHNIIRRVNASGTIETIAGSGVAGFSGDGGQARSALLFSPTSPRYDVYGNLYFYDSGNNRIRRIDAKGVISTLAGDGIPFAAGMDAAGPAALISLDRVVDLAVDGAGNVYFTENSHRLRRVTPAGKVEVFAGTGSQLCGGCSNGDGGLALAAMLESPASLTVDPRGDVFFVDGHAIRKIAPDGTISTFVPPIILEPPPAIEFPASIGALATDAGGNLYAVAAISVPAAIYRFDTHGTRTTIVGGTNSQNSTPMARRFRP